MSRQGSKSVRRAWSALGLTAAVALGPLSGSFAEVRSVTKMCIDGRQTSDPNSPPCVAYFDGDNGGTTWQGVDAEEITVVVYLSTAITRDANGPAETPPAGTYCDVDLLDCDGDGVADDDTHPWTRVANAYSRYFNSRFQTYGRHVHAYIYWSGATSPSARRADAAENWERFKPFAVINQASFGGFHSTYSSSMAQRHTTTFGNLEGEPRALFAAHGGRMWDWWPDAEAHADQYAGYVCSKVAGTPVSGGQFAGQQRRYGFYSSSDLSDPADQHLATLIKSRLADCGVEIEPGADLTFPDSGWSLDTSGDRTYGLVNVTAMQKAGVNTILWAGGTETDTSKFADLSMYSPEWIVSGDGLMESASYGRSQGQVSWNNAWIVSARPRLEDDQNDPAYVAYREAEPDGVDAEWAREVYRDWFLLFTAIQTAGPELTPVSVEEGLRALAPKESTDPYTVSGSFPPGEFTYVKDANEQWWDSSAEGATGCYRLVSGGTRYFSKDWANATESGLGSLGLEKDTVRDPCNRYDHSSSLRPGLPSLPLSLLPALAP